MTRRCRYCHQLIVPGTGHLPVRAANETPAHEWDACTITGVSLEAAEERCSGCGGLLVYEWIMQPPLLRHGGYGGAERTTTTSCSSCGRLGGVNVETVNPRGLA